MIQLRKCIGFLVGHWWRVAEVEWGSGCDIDGEADAEGWCSNFVHFGLYNTEDLSKDFQDSLAKSSSVMLGW
jgi:hypothetical protein